MSNKTIAKFWGFVIFTAAVAAIFSGCSMTPAANVNSSKASHFESPKITGKLANPEITESSGIAASKCQNDVFWTHNDSGDDAYIFALDKSGAKLGTWKVPNAANFDWEDISLFKDTSGKCFIYVAEIGDNQSQRDEHVVYRIREPKAGPENSSATKQQPLTTEPADAIRFVYRDSRHNAETLMVHPVSGDIYVVTKRVSGPAGVYRLKPDFGNRSAVKAEKVSDLSVPAIPNGFLTGGDISPDGKRLVICDYSAAYEFVLPDGAKNFDAIWKQEPESIDVGSRKIGEAVTYTADGRSIFLTSEGKGTQLIEVIRKN